MSQQQKKRKVPQDTTRRLLAPHGHPVILIKVTLNCHPIQKRVVNMKSQILEASRLSIKDPSISLLPQTPTNYPWKVRPNDRGKTIQSGIHQLWISSRKWEEKDQKILRWERKKLQTACPMTQWIKRWLIDSSSLRHITHRFAICQPLLWRWSMVRISSRKAFHIMNETLGVWCSWGPFFRVYCGVFGKRGIEECSRITKKIVWMVIDSIVCQTSSWGLIKEFKG